MSCHLSVLSRGVQFYITWWESVYHFMHPIDFTFHTARSSPEPVAYPRLVTSSLWDPVSCHQMAPGLWLAMIHLVTETSWSFPMAIKSRQVAGQVARVWCNPYWGKKILTASKDGTSKLFLAWTFVFSLGVCKVVCWNCPIYMHTHTHTQINYIIYIYIYYTHMITKRLPGVWHTYVYLYVCLNHGISKMVHLEVLRLQRWVPGKLWRRSGALWSQLLARPFEGQGRWGVNDMAMAWLWMFLPKPWHSWLIASSNLGFPGVCSLFDDQ